MTSFKEDLATSSERDIDIAVLGKYVLLFPPDKTNEIRANFARFDRRSSFDTFVAACDSDSNDSGLLPLEADLAIDYK